MERTFENDPILKLAQYWISAGIMKKHVQDYRNNYPGLQGMNDDVWGDFIVYTSFWLSALYVVVEGFQELKLKDSKIEELLSEAHVKSLRLYRNSTFHFQKTNAKHNQFYDEDRMNWAQELYVELGRFFRNY